MTTGPNVETPSEIAPIIQWFYWIRAKKSRFALLLLLIPVYYRSEITTWHGDFVGGKAKIAGLEKRVAEELNRVNRLKEEISRVELKVADTDKQRVESAAASRRWEDKFHDLNANVAPFIAQAVRLYPNDGATSALQKLTSEVEQIKRGKTTLSVVSCSAMITLQTSSPAIAFTGLNRAGMVYNNLAQQVHLLDGDDVLASGTYNEITMTPSGANSLLVGLDVLLHPRHLFVGASVKDLSLVDGMAVELHRPLGDQSTNVVGAELKLVVNENTYYKITPLRCNLDNPKCYVFRFKRGMLSGS